MKTYAIPDCKLVNYTAVWTVDSYDKCTFQKIIKNPHLFEDTQCWSWLNKWMIKIWSASY